MASKNRGQSGGVNISGGTVKVGGDIVGRDKTVSYGLSEKNLTEITKLFEQILRRVENNSTVTDKAGAKKIVSLIEREVKRGEAAETSKVKDLLLSLAAIADDIYQVTLLALTNPIAGIAKGIQMVARALRQAS
jgi:hypothetical protein